MLRDKQIAISPATKSEQETSTYLEQGLTAPDPEVRTDKPQRTFTARYKLKLLEELDHCDAGQVGAILRREGLYSSHVTNWRRQRKEGSLAGLTAAKRGKAPKQEDPSAHRIAELEKAKVHLEHRLKQAELIIDVQKKVSEMFGVSLERPESKRTNS